ncbi:hypothetical protein B566_EDAN007154 [Ephemera danica]|nr:hypothetical protein B566_EDAN007154 [Ephemera danica]
MQRASLLLLLAASLFISPVLPSRTKRQIFDPQGAEQDFPPPGFAPQQRPPFGRPGAFGPQGDAGFGPQRPPGFGAQRPPLGFGSQRPPAGFGPQGAFGSGGPPQDFDQFGPDGQQFIRPRPPYRPHAPNNPYTLPGLDPLGGISKALESIARYDDKRCMARMLCEVAAGGSPGSGYRGTSGFFDFSGLRGIAESYPECPRDPDRLVDYLNNHNGGFFKLFNPQEPIQEEPTTRRPPYFRRGKKKYPPEGSSGFDENRPLSPSKDVPISGKPPILAETDYNYDDQSNYVTARPQRDIYTDPTRPYKKRKPVFFDQSAPLSNQNNNNFNNDRPSAPNRIVFDDNKIPQSYQTTAKPNYNKDYYTTPKPTYNYDLYSTNRPQQYNTARPSVIRFDQSQYTTPRPNKNQYVNSRPFYEKYTTPRPNRGVAFQNSDQNDEYYVDDDATSGSVMYVTPIPLYGQPGNVYSNPSRVLWAQSSRPSKTSRNFDVLPQFKFPATNSRTNVHDTSSLLFPTDRTGTGELRLDTEQLEASSAQLQHRELAESSRGGKSLNFPDSVSTSQHSANKPSSSSGTVTFPNP